MKNLSLLLFIIFLPNNAMANVIADNLFVKEFLDGPNSQKAPSAISKDKYGTVWLAFNTYVIRVSNGIRKRVDVDFLPGTQNKLDTPRSIVHIDEKTFLAYQKHLYFFSKTANKFEPYSPYNNQNDLHFIYDLAQNSHQLLVTNKYNLYIIEVAINKVHKFKVTHENSKSKFYISRAIDHTSGYLGASNGGLFKYNLETQTIAKVPLKAFDNLPIYSLLNIENNWLIGTSKGLFKLEPSLELTSVCLENNLTFVTDLLVSKRNQVRFLANDYLFTYKNNRCIPNKELKVFSNTVKSYTIKSIYSDDEDALLLGVWQKGLLKSHFSRNKIKGSKQKFENVRFLDDYKGRLVYSTGNEIIGNKKVKINKSTYSSYNHSNKKMLYGSLGGFYEFVDEDNVSYRKLFDLGASEGRYLGFKVDSSNRLWSVDSNLGVQTFSYPGLEKIKNSFISIDGKLRKDTHALYSASGAPNFIFFVNNNKVYLYDTELNKVLFEQEVFNSTTSIQNSFQIDNDVYFTSTANHLSVMDLNTNIISPINIPNEINNIGCLIQRSESSWLIAQASGGLFDWNPKTNQVKFYDEYDGIPSGGLNGKVCKKIDGEYVFSSFKSLVTFDPDHSVNEVPAKANILSIHSPNNAYFFEDLNNKVKINDNDFPLQFEIANSSTVAPEKNITEYRITPLNRSWQKLQGDKLMLQTLAPNDYTIEVRGFNNDGFGGDINAYNFVVLPPVYLSWWAKLAYALATLLCFYAFYSYKMRASRNKALQLEQQVEQRTVELENEKQTVERLLSYKEQELVNVSHELRTPITLISGPLKSYVQDHGKLAEPKIDMAYRNSLRLSRIVDQLLQLERFHLQKSIDKHPQNVTDIIEFIVESFKVPASKKHQTISINRNDKMTLNFAVDAFEKILTNLVSNAIKYTQDGGEISVNSYRENNQYFLIVKDNGKGISDENQTLLFNKFFRVLDSDSERTPGAGIGLALVKELVEFHQGSIAIESSIGQGSVFTITLPYEDAVVLEASSQINPDIIQMELEDISVDYASVTLDAEPASADNNMPQVLIIEDNLDMQAYIKSTLANRFQCITADNGKDGVEMAKKHSPDIIISDIMMPVMDGFEATKIVKESVETSHIPVIMLTARGDRDSRMEGWKSLTDEYLAKPFDEEELLLRVDNLLSIRALIAQRTGAVIAQSGSLSNSIASHLNERDITFIETLEALLKQNYQNSDFSVERLAELIFLDKRQLQRKIKSLLNHSPSEYLRVYRLNMAKTKISAGMQINVVAFDCGFASQSYFSRCFKAQFDITPSELQMTAG
jgi:signal transduction histidine kinase/DNA-binding response OmpR family regulator